MENKLKIYAMIPARLGSVRLKKKNIALIHNKPLLEYAIKAAKDANIFDKIFLNSESKKLKMYADKYNINFYNRNSSLAKSQTKSDFVVKDFFEKFQDASILVWVNTTTPFQTGEEIKKVVKFFLKKKGDTLITTEKKFAHVNYLNKPLNYIKNSKFARTQDLKPISTFLYSLMMWRRETFFKSFKKYKSGILSGKVIFYPLSGLSRLMIKHREDLVLADFIARHKKKFKVRYAKLFNKNKK
jgi:CMP-N-acetylneuraminic acid synthetase